MAHMVVKFAIFPYLNIAEMLHLQSVLDDETKYILRRRNMTGERLQYKKEVGTTIALMTSLLAASVLS